MALAASSRYIPAQKFVLELLLKEIQTKLSTMLMSIWAIAANKRINSLAGSLGQKHVGTLRFAQYYSLRIFARYAGRYIPKELVWIISNSLKKEKKNTRQFSYYGQKK